MAKHVLWAILTVLLAASSVRAESAGDPRQMKDEAVKILQQGSGMTVPPELYAEAVVKLEKALDILEGQASPDEKLLQECTTALFWARKFTTMDIINAIQRKQGAAPTPVKHDPPKPVQKKPENQEEAPSPLQDAKRLFSEGEMYARSNSSDDYAVALRWFQVADQTAGTDYSLKALAHAREAQERFASRQQPAENKTPAPALPEQAQAAKRQADGGDYDAAIKTCLEALKAKKDIETQRQLAHAYFGRAQQIKERLLPQFEAAEQEYREAYRGAWQEYRTTRGTFKRLNKNHPPLLEVQRKAAGLQVQAKEAFKFYDDAGYAFKAVLDMAPGGKDFDAAAHACLCLSVKGEINTRFAAQNKLYAFINAYTPANDVERTLYAYCKSEWERLKAGK